MQVFRRLTLAAAATVWVWAAPVSAGDPLTLPSGLQARSLEPIWDEDMSVIRLRYVVPQLREPASLYADDPFRVFADMQWICETQFTKIFQSDRDPMLEGWTGAVITLMSSEIEFGQRDPEIIQLFEEFEFAIEGCVLPQDDYHD